uniref:Alpha-1 2-Mannosidase n=1 Tax=Rhizophora mucronata TaxID=61149 RepID=A0A2P2LSW7_RHIMU
MKRTTVPASNSGGWFLLILLVFLSNFCGLSSSMSQLDPRSAAKKIQMREKVREIFLALING